MLGTIVLHKRKCGNSIHFVIPSYYLKKNHLEEYNQLIVEVVEKIK